MGDPPGNERMRKTDYGVKGNGPQQLVPAHREDVAGEDLADVLRALRRAIHQQQRGGRGDHVDHADLRFLRHARRP